MGGQIAGIEWTTVLLAVVAIIPSTIAAVGTYLLHREIRTPSGDRIGAVAERTHDLTATDVALTTAIHQRVLRHEQVGDPHTHSRQDD